MPPSAPPSILKRCTRTSAPQTAPQSAPTPHPKPPSTSPSISQITSFQLSGEIGKLHQHRPPRLRTMTQHYHDDVDSTMMIPQPLSMVRYKRACNVLMSSADARKTASTGTPNCMPPSTRPSSSQSSIHQHPKQHPPAPQTACPLAPGRQAIHQHPKLHAP